MSPCPTMGSAPGFPRCRLPVPTLPSSLTAASIFPGGSNASGNTVVNPASTITAYTMGNPNGSLTTGTPIDFSEARRYLKCASAWWGALAPNGTGAVLFGQLTLTGIDGALNIFQLDAANVYGSGLSLAQLNGINIVAPASSTILINITGPAIQFGSYQIFRNGLTATP
ncbi:MAG: choice-of-anchor A family protein [Acutalibacteraceae bacterium]